MRPLCFYGAGSRRQADKFGVGWKKGVNPFGFIAIPAHAGPVAALGIADGGVFSLPVLEAKVGDLRHLHSVLLDSRIFISSAHCRPRSLSQMEY